MNALNNSPVTINSKYVSHVTVLDPDSRLPVDVEIRKAEGGYMLGVDASFLSQTDEPIFDVVSGHKLLLPKAETIRSETSSFLDATTAIQSLMTDMCMVKEGHELDADAADAAIDMIKNLSRYLNLNGLEPTLTDTYQVVALNTSHLPESEIGSVCQSNSGMALIRSEGVFIKLYEELEETIELWSAYPVLTEILKWAHQKGFRMVEFDQAAPELDQFTVFEW